MEPSIACDHCGTNAPVIRFVNHPGQLEQQGQAKGLPTLKPYFIIRCPKCGEREVVAKLVGS